MSVEIDEHGTVTANGRPVARDGVRVRAPCRHTLATQTHRCRSHRGGLGSPRGETGPMRPGAAWGGAGQKFVDGI